MGDLKRGYPTPNAPEEITMTSRCVFVPDIPEFIALIGGQLFETTKTYYWRAMGDMSPQECAELMQDALALYDASVEGECALTCEKIIECIESDPDTAIALQQWLNDNGYGSAQGTPNSPAYYNQNETILDGSLIADCDNDNLFGGITQMIDFINGRWTDFFEQAETISNGVERLQLAVQGIPVIETLPFDELIAFVDQLMEELAEGYAAGFTADWRDEVRCDLFCIAIDACELDFQAFADYFFGRVGATITGEDIATFLTWFTTGAFVGSGLVDAAYALVCSCLAYSSEILGININGLATSLTAAMNDPNSDWEILCEECLPPTIEPEIGLGVCSNLNPIGGTNLTNTTGVTWTLEATENVGVDWRASIVRQGGGYFHLDNVSAISGVVTFHGWKTDTGACLAGFVPPDPLVNNMEVWLWTSSSPFTVQFDFLEAP